MDPKVIPQRPQVRAWYLQYPLWLSFSLGNPPARRGLIADVLADDVMTEFNLSKVPIADSAIPGVCLPLHAKRLREVQSDEMYNHSASCASPPHIDRSDTDVENIREFSPVHTGVLYDSLDCSIHSVLEADQEHPQCHGSLDEALKSFAKTVFKDGPNTYDEVEKQKAERGRSGE